jgi:hypothetical protein
VRCWKCHQGHSIFSLCCHTRQTTGRNERVREQLNGIQPISWGFLPLAGRSRRRQLLHTISRRAEVVVGSLLVAGRFLQLGYFPRGNTGSRSGLFTWPASLFSAHFGGSLSGNGRAAANLQCGPCSRASLCSFFQQSSLVMVTIWGSAASTGGFS